MGRIPSDYDHTSFIPSIEAANRENVDEDLPVRPTFEQNFLLKACCPTVDRVLNAIKKLLLVTADQLLKIRVISEFHSE